MKNVPVTGTARESPDLERGPAGPFIRAFTGQAGSRATFVGTRFAHEFYHRVAVVHAQHGSDLRLLLREPCGLAHRVHLLARRLRRLARRSNSTTDTPKIMRLNCSNSEYGWKFSNSRGIPRLSLFQAMGIADSLSLPNDPRPSRHQSWPASPHGFCGFGAKSMLLCTWKSPSRYVAWKENGWESAHSLSFLAISSHRR